METESEYDGTSLSMVLWILIPPTIGAGQSEVSVAIQQFVKTSCGLHPRGLVKPGLTTLLEIELGWHSADSPLLLPYREIPY